MISVKDQNNTTNSSHLEGSSVLNSQKEDTQSTKEEEPNLTDTVNKKKSKIVTTDVKDSTKDEAEITNCDGKKNHKSGEDVVVSENDKKEDKPSLNKVETEKQNTESLNIVPHVYENNSKISKSENTKEVTTKNENNLKRTRRSIATQEADVLSEEIGSRSKRKKKNATDRFCWRCHKENVETHCSACPRSWHRKCIGMQQSPIQNWICGECAAILRAENAETRSTAMAQLSVDQLCLLLKHVVERMKEHPGSEPFWRPVELFEAPNYLDYVVKPMDLSLLESNVRAKLYGSTDAFMADAKWIQHNCIVFNTCGGVYTDTSKLTNAAKQIIKLARQEVSEIEACPDCYAHGRNLPRPQPAWFIEPCRRPHPLVWAKLKGFPFWPAKAMPRINSQGFVDVRFFGEHDRAWVSPRDLYLYSEDPPVPLPRKRKLDMEECVREITRHCRKLELVFGQFKFAPPRVQYNPHDPMQIKLLLPNYDPLNSNNTCISPHLLVPKKTTFFKKRLQIKSKLQKNSEKADNSDIENKISNEFTNSITERSKSEEEEAEKVQASDKLYEGKSTKVTSGNLNESMEVESKEHVKINKNLSTNSEVLMKEDVKPSTSKINTTDVNNGNSSITTEKQELVEQNNNFESITNDNNAKSSENSSKQEVIPLKKHIINDIQVSKKESLIKGNVNKGDANHNSINSQKNNLKGTKSVAKVYKPKTRIVDKMNAEKALKSIAAEQSQKSNSGESVIVTKLQNDSSKHCSNNSLVAAATSVLANKPHIDGNKDSDAGVKKNATDQSVGLLFVVNDGTLDTAKKTSSSLNAEKEKRIDTSVQIQQTSKDSTSATHQQIKESKARKSFSSKGRNCPQLIPHSSMGALSNSYDSTIYKYMPSNQSEKIESVEYQMLPPEAGPLSARLYHDAQDLARKMAKLMEEAYKEAAQENQNCENGTISENHQATVHFLRLQIERMRWQHQQQLAELKHNTDRILREMKASLEAERLRAIEETRREAEEEKLRCIEEIKRKQWCAMCGEEALFYCCWNTAYCDYPCQQSHWPMHMRTCAQKPSFTTIVTSSTANSNQQQVMPRLMINAQHATSNMWRA